MEGKEQYRAKLTPTQWRVAMENGTEQPGSGEYVNNKEDGVYYSIAAGAPLFSSQDKFDSGTGLPSFSKVIVDSNVKEITDSTHGMQRTEVRSGDDDIHLGHVFNDWPSNKGGMRYCINSASLKFVPKDDLSKEDQIKYGFLEVEENK